MSAELLKSVCNGNEVDAGCKNLTSTFSKATLAQVEEAAVVATIKAALDTAGKPGAVQREAGCKAFGALCVTLDTTRVCEPSLAELLPEIISACGDKFRPVQIAAQEAVVAFGKSCHRDACPYLVPKCLLTSQKWQANVARINLLKALSDKAPLQVSRNCADAIPNLAEGMWSTKKEEKIAARETMTTICNSVENKDIKQFIPMLIEAIENPKEVIETIHKLAGIVFVELVEAGALSIMSPLLIRGFAESKVATKRQCARIIENMAKLVENPLDVKPFIPRLLPLLAKAKEEVSDPECREVCGKAYDILLKKSDTSKVHIAKLNSVETMMPVICAATGVSNPTGYQKAMLEYTSRVALSIMDLKMFEADIFQTILSPFISIAAPKCDVPAAVQKIFEVALEDFTPEPEVEEDDNAEELCNTMFTLAYGTKILLKNTLLKLKRGLKYGLIGQNDSGKTSLMRAIADGKVEGFPDASEVRTVFVETDIHSDLSHLTVVEYMYADETLKSLGITRDEMSAALQAAGFSPSAPANVDSLVGGLSGGWRMKLALTRAMLLKADILLLDEPTNHLDSYNVKWVEKYLLGLTHVTCIMVSHDTGFINRVCTNMIQISDLKLKFFKGNLAAFAEADPDVRRVMEVKKSDKEPFTFPPPGNLEGITTKGKPILKMTDITFTYPGAPGPQLRNVTVRCSLASRVACVGVNGAGKSTMIKLLTGELEADAGSGEVWKHPNCRIAYVAQHAFHHIENHLDKTPNEYIRWRYQYGKDKEALEKVTMVISEEEKKKMAEKFNFNFTDANGVVKKEQVQIKKLTEGRRQLKKEFEYEVEFVGKDSSITAWFLKEDLVKKGWEKIIKETDDAIAMRASAAQRLLSVESVEQHLEGFALHREFGTHTRIQALSGGQKVKVVMAACMWNNPHLLILDEPTNYLDRESLAQLAGAISSFEGGVVMITHNNDFCEELCPEVWHLENNTLNLKGDAEWMKNALSEKVEKKEEATETIDAAGNVTKVKGPKVKLSRQEQRKREKRRKARRAQGLDVSDTEDESE